VLRFLADENFNNAILRGLLRRNPAMAITRVQDTAQGGAGDPDVLAWAAEQRMIVLTHDVTTMTDYAYARVASTQPMPGVFVIAQDAAPGPIIEELLLIVECSEEEDWANQVWYLPLR
jgi:predicted nuclease of predicted toxin-antitoxin system